ncbi:hypothetical protein RR45_GL001376 [Lactococcus chungangensis CAU 28 = DSM 22330]|uniref:Uncharacterized protein n=1 Tax=Pseudolactococcus chungangensis CAU 28 = DSM 22330 TaxID=1122154 RepID=A0ABX4I4P8_9LACT|nr:hypothetical protein RR45_GL001376 [Lactococcus chungangensis CAU 28 = DSM 22330]
MYSENDFPDSVGQFFCKTSNLFIELLVFFISLKNYDMIL